MLLRAFAALARLVTRTARPQSWELVRAEARLVAGAGVWGEQTAAGFGRC
jgi:hypothetical protein